MLDRRLGVLVKLADASRDAKATPALRIVASAIEAAGGIVPRLPLRLSLDAIEAEERKWLRKIGITIGALDLFDPRLMKPEAARWRRALASAAGRTIAAPRDGATVLARGSDGATLEAGFRSLGIQAVRVDLIERIARAAHDSRQGRTPFAPDPALATSIGLDPASLERLMAELGFKALAGDTPRWVWRGRPPARAVAPAPIDPSRQNAFAGLAALVRHG
jgi:ATP-dependent RNA helicase SUPV3L1/SUV3